MENTPSQLRQEILMHWQIQENLLQSYRLMFLITQTIIFCAALLTTSRLLAFLILSILGITLLVCWVQIAGARALDVSYFQMQLMKQEKTPASEPVITQFKAWQRLSKMEKEKRLAEYGLHQSQTRRKMEKVIPMLFAGLWAAVLLISLLTTLI
ncbi:MAG: hypothetical protein JSS79_17475 [Bacteroidetes bacterium]|nr:hypothetical protein [Bacteroidota bacterium]